MQTEKHNTWRGICVFLLLFALMLSLFPLAACARKEDVFTVRVLDVGEGDAILLSVDNHFMLIDATEAEEHDALFGQLASAGVKKLDRFVITHPHADHFGCARSVIERYTPDILTISPIASEEEGYAEALAAAAAIGAVCVTVATGDTFDFCGTAFEVLHVGGNLSINNASMILRAAWGECVFLFMADAEAPAEKLLLSLYPAEHLACDFLKAGHHGSASGCTAAFLEIASPMYVAISCGRDNSYGFPAAEVLDNFAAVDAAVARTDLEGCLTYKSDGKSVERQKSERVGPFFKKKEQNDGE